MLMRIYNHFNIYFQPLRPQRTPTSVTCAPVSEVHAMMSTQEVATTSRTAVPLVTPMTATAAN